MHHQQFQHSIQSPPSQFNSFHDDPNPLDPDPDIDNLDPDDDPDPDNPDPDLDNPDPDDIPDPNPDNPGPDDDDF